MNQIHKTVPRNRWVALLLAACVGATLLLVAYIVSIGPVYYVWARWSANMSTHERIEGFYAPLLQHGPEWLTAYRDVSRIAGHQAGQ